MNTPAPQPDGHSAAVAARRLVLAAADIGMVVAAAGRHSKWAWGRSSQSLACIVAGVRWGVEADTAAVVARMCSARPSRCRGTVADRDGDDGARKCNCLLIVSFLPYICVCVCVWSSYGGRTQR